MRLGVESLQKESENPHLPAHTDIWEENVQSQNYTIECKPSPKPYALNPKPYTPLDPLKEPL